MADADDEVGTDEDVRFTELDALHLLIDMPGPDEEQQLHFTVNPGNKTMNGFIDRHRSLVILLSALLPIVVAAAIAPFRASVENTNAALVLVLVVVAAASTGIRAAGVIAALSSALAFDFFLTAPFNRFTITDRADIETAVLLLVVGVGVTEIALWGRREQAKASREHGYLTGVLDTVGSVALADYDPADLTTRVATQLTDVLGLDAARFEAQLTPAPSAQLHHDGTVSRTGHLVDIDRSGLPTDTTIDLLVRSGGSVYGRYVLTASTRVRRPTLEQRRVAVALADQVGVALAKDSPNTPD